MDLLGIFHFAMLCRELANAQPNDHASEIDFGQTPNHGNNDDLESKSVADFFQPNAWMKR